MVTILLFSLFCLSRYVDQDLLTAVQNASGNLFLSCIMFTYTKVLILSVSYLNFTFSESYSYRKSLFWRASTFYFCVHTYYCVFFSPVLTSILTSYNAFMSVFTLSIICFLLVFTQSIMQIIEIICSPLLQNMENKIKSNKKKIQELKIRRAELRKISHSVKDTG